LIASPDGQIAVDLAGGAFGRGVWVHPSPSCLGAAPRGLARSFRRPILSSASDLADAIAEASERRTMGLLSSAARSRCVAIGSDAVVQALGEGHASLVVVARDAAAAASRGPVMAAVADGRAVAFGTKASLGALFERAEVAVLAVDSPRIASAIRRSVMAGQGAAAPRTEHAITAEGR
jgi:ribosomal protein L7Ae-like RNA K-turn-binding protein